MKKLLLLTSAFVALNSFCSIAQKATTSKPLARMDAPQKNEGTPKVTIGTIESSVTSREKVLAYPRLLAQELNCEITGFTFSITSNNKTWGPYEVKGAVFPEDVKDKIKDAEAPPKVKITIDNIRLKCNGGAEETASPITVEYDH